ncbi:cuscuta receptor 1-like isoform X3 [Carex rostrata]
MKLLLPVALLVLVLVPIIQWENACVSGSDSDSESESVQCREEERLALLHINASIHFPIHSLDGKWEGKECCRWERVTCHPITGHVTQLELGVYDDVDWSDYFHGGISLNASMFLPLRQLRSLSLSAHGIYNCTDGAGLETWSNLTKLEILDLSDNYLDGSIIYDLASVPSLRELDLSDNNINSSSLPINGFESWSNLTKLQMLDLSYNHLLISIFSSLAKVSSLRVLYLDYNYYLEGNINVPVKELINALNLEVLSLSLCELSGSLPDLGHWSSLKALSLTGNDLNDTLSLEGLCRLKNLEELDLSSNNFTGNLPPCLGNLSSLKLVDLSYNKFQIKFPSSIFDRLVSLRYLSLSNNQIEGTLSMRSFWNHSNLEVLSISTLESSSFRVKVVNMPFQLQVLELANCILDVEPTFLYSQYKLRALDLSNTGSKGPLSVIWLLKNNTNLIKLDLHKNFFMGPLQLPFLTHEKLSLLDISDNHLGGELPGNITTKFPNLLSLSLSKNYFQGPLPLISTRNLENLDLSSNNLTDDVHISFSRIQPSFPNFMDLSNNKFYGSFTDNWNFTQGSTLLLNNNNISGYIPFSICNTSFEVLDISNNELNGVLPNCIGRADIWSLKLSGNHLEGSLPSLEMSNKLYHDWQKRWLLDLSDNKLSGSIPPCSNDTALEIINVSQNNLTGNFPITWLNISMIYAIDIGENYLSRELPIGLKANLSILLAKENMFGGLIPEQICQFRYLRILDLSYNNLFGKISSCIIDMGSIVNDSSISENDRYESVPGEGDSNFDDSNFLIPIIYFFQIDGAKLSNFGLELVLKGRLDLYFEDILQMQGIINLSSNRLVGNIPKDIGRMNWLITLDLSNNHLSGGIPNSISNLLQLENLDLSHNSLTGEIPREMTKLTSLASFSVAYNNLFGPTLGVEAQFISFDNSSYEGNPDLCGPPLSKICGSTPSTTQPSLNKMSENQRYDGTDLLILFGSFSLFFVVSFWCFMLVLYFNRNWRYALFTLVD